MAQMAELLFHLSREHFSLKIHVLDYLDLCLLVCLFEWTPSQRKEVSIPLGIFPHVWEQNKLSYFPRPGQSYHRSCQELNPALGSTPISHADPGTLEFSLRRRNPDVRTAPNRAPGIVPGHFEPLGGSLSTSHPQIPPSQ